MPVSVSVTLNLCISTEERDPSETKRVDAKNDFQKTSIGRTAEVEGQPRKSSVNVKLTESEKSKLEAKAAGVPLSSYIRSVLIDVGVL